jgi:hypothetical protein
MATKDHQGNEVSRGVMDVIKAIDALKSILVFVTCPVILPLDHTTG